MKEFEMGPLQKMWVQSLKDHPERQGKNRLGLILSDGTYTACCLGELLMCYKRMENTEVDVVPEGSSKSILDDGPIVNESFLQYSYKKFGLNNSVGKLNCSVTTSKGRFEGLAVMNDEGVSWLEIANIIENDPSNVFTHAV